MSSNSVTENKGISTNANTDNISHSNTATKPQVGQKVLIWHYFVGWVDGIIKNTENSTHGWDNILVDADGLKEPVSVVIDGMYIKQTDHDLEYLTQLGQFDNKLTAWGPSNPFESPEPHTYVKVFHSVEGCWKTGMVVDVEETDSETLLLICFEGNINDLWQYNYDGIYVVKLDDMDDTPNEYEPTKSLDFENNIDTVLGKHMVVLKREVIPAVVIDIMCAHSSDLLSKHNKKVVKIKESKTKVVYEGKAWSQQFGEGFNEMVMDSIKQILTESLNYVKYYGYDKIHTYGAYMITEDQSGEQLPHIDYAWESVNVNLKPWIAFFPLTSEGTVINIWKHPYQFPFQLRLELYDIVFLRGDIIHSCTFAPQSHIFFMKITANDYNIEDGPYFVVTQDSRRRHFSDYFTSESLSPWYWSGFYKQKKYKAKKWDVCKSK